ncbi:hypothetical protein [Georhizobium sp. MAB10]|uniref:hypothetical protein n=1 Tax=Georhizobium sp. MAB10 TaxID=3028319 RepID=UPI003855DEA8
MGGIDPPAQFTGHADRSEWMIDSVRHQNTHWTIITLDYQAEPIRRRLIGQELSLSVSRAEVERQRGSRVKPLQQGNDRQPILNP